MTSATIDAWLCKNCNDVSPGYNFPSEEKCRWCGMAKPDVVTLEQISMDSPSAQYLLSYHSKNAAKQRKSRQNGEKGASKKAPKQPEELELEERFNQYWLESNTGYTLTRQHRGIVKGVNKKGKIVYTNHKFDFALPSHSLAIEIQGGIFNRGRHVRPQGYHDDRAKIRKASLQGWTVWEFTTTDMKKDNLHNVVNEILAKIQQIEGLEKRIAA